MIFFFYLEHTIYLHVKENRKKNIPIMPPDLAICLTLLSSNYACFEHIFMVPKVFEPLKIHCIAMTFEFHSLKRRGMSAVESCMY